MVECCGLGPISRKDYEAQRIDISRVLSPRRIGVLVGGAPAVGHAAAFNWHDINGVDWMTPVKSQSTCGSCWAFGPVAVLESAINIADNNPNLDLNLSEEHLVKSCGCPSVGCGSGEGGWPSEALRFIRVSGIADESWYPYTATDGACGIVAGWEPHSCESEEYINETVDSIKSALETYGPLVVIIEHDADWMHKSDGGRYSANHCVTLCGWQDDASVSGGGYWILKNSHGTGFRDPGEDPGYGRIRYGVLERHHYARAIDNPSFPNQAPPCEDHTTQATCEAAGCHWYNNACHTDPEPPPPPPPCEDHITQATCEAAGCYWYGDACHTSPSEPGGEIVAYGHPEYAHPGEEITIRATIRNNTNAIRRYRIDLIHPPTDTLDQVFWWFSANETVIIELVTIMPTYDWDLRIELWREM